MKYFKQILIASIVISGLFLFTERHNANTNLAIAEYTSISIEPLGSKIIYHTRRSTTLAGLTNTMIYNDGIYCGQLTLQSWSYEKDFSTGRMWYVGIYKGTVRSNGGCPIG
ncbi:MULTISPECIES: hypothetical protein [Enterococcus]|uniref:Uncharacterized protein n=1 Tax=Enterococcus mundtii TaxID=53346 RepID=A0A848MXV5_ENTMU|nr:hypothetical protein [Enterococcus mundtii]MBE9910928.1 hypothetical protein [Enterococcus mundtii]MDY4307801.1 hypothetical protein [Enterococcus mundtii]MRI74317.1 hypothetical protein [Enterococcus mundtii]NMP58785.1 hypothetical protein [Enterococcus mundtii]UBM06102.1 hypothetical protein K9N66_02730 [Enterococcus mundtii]